MDECDLRLRELTYELFIELGRAPTADEVASAIATTRADVQSGWRRLHDAHALVLNAAATEIRMANPLKAR